MRADDYAPRPLVSELARARATHPPRRSRGRKSVHFSPSPSDGQEQLEVLQLELHALTTRPPCANANISEYKYTEKASNFGTELGWIWPRNRAFFFLLVEEAQFFGESGGFLHVENHDGRPGRRAQRGEGELETAPSHRERGPIDVPALGETPWYFNTSMSR